VSLGFSGLCCSWGRVFVILFWDLSVLGLLWCCAWCLNYHTYTVHETHANAT